MEDATQRSDERGLARVRGAALNHERGRVMGKGRFIHLC